MFFDVWKAYKESCGKDGWREDRQEVLADLERRIRESERHNIAPLEAELTRRLERIERLRNFGWDAIMALRGTADFDEKTPPAIRAFLIELHK